MDPYSQFFTHFAFAQMLICFLLLLPAAKDNLSVRLFSLLMFCGCGYLISEVFGPMNKPSLLWWLEYTSGNALPGVFWLVSLSVFADRNEIKPWQYIVASLTLLVPMISTSVQMALGFDLRTYPSFFGLVTYGAMSLELVLICHALAVAIKNWQADLVQERRYIRGTVISLTAFYLFLVIVVEQLFNLQWIWLDTAKYLMLVLLMILVNLQLFSLRKSTLFDQPKPVQPVSNNKKKEPPAELKRILEAMETEKLYRQEGITISALSRHLTIHEYKLRQLINGELNFRNFNDFLNHYRIQEVADKLCVTENQQVPVLTLALESGFRSLSSFNKAFKTTHGVTPTEYRSKQLMSDVIAD